MGKKKLFSESVLRCETKFFFCYFNNDSNPVIENVRKTPFLKKSQKTYPNELSNLTTMRKLQDTSSKWHIFYLTVEKVYVQNNGKERFFAKKALADCSFLQKFVVLFSICLHSDRPCRQTNNFLLNDWKLLRQLEDLCKYPNSENRSWLSNARWNQWKKKYFWNWD